MKKLILLIMCCMILGTGNAWAKSSKMKGHAWELGTELFHIEYEEPGVMEQDGMMYGIVGSYSYRQKRSGVMLKADGRFSAGQLDYENSGTLDDKDNYMFEVRGVVGYDFYMKGLNRTILTPYAGIGYRYLNDDASDMVTSTVASTGVRGYERESNYLYSPIGVTIITPLKNDWSFGATVEYDIFWRGEQVSHFSDVVSSWNDPENTQKDGYGARGSIRFQKKYAKKRYFIIEPYIRYWDIDQSESADITSSGTYVGSRWEPENNSTAIGVTAAFIF